MERKLQPITKNKNGRIKNITICTVVSPEFYNLCLEHDIRFNEALRVGISMALAEKNVKPYDNNLTISRRLTAAITHLEETSQKLQKYVEKYGELN